MDEKQFVYLLLNYLLEGIKWIRLLWEECRDKERGHNNQRRNKSPKKRGNPSDKFGR